jgi:hypothetical protein
VGCDVTDQPLTIFLFVRYWRKNRNIMRHYVSYSYTSTSSVTVRKDSHRDDQNMLELNV